ncbi:MAG: DEAD/DEAH box helicase, partial [Fibrobacteraceae bacterium]|nr:DEAD/DEAH box helicase [Fibrobacteraceae bacterium]
MDDKPFQSLPLYPSAKKILDEISKNRNLLLTAPTGTGKSTFIPWLLSGQKEGKARIAVLEPRRLATTSLSAYLSRLSKEPEGKTVGYKIRFESCTSSDTRIFFTTYGSFLQSAIHGTTNFDWIIFDEFHERRAEMDLLLAHFLALQKKNPENTPRIAILSAELNREELENLLGVECLKVGVPSYPVEILRQNSTPGTPLSSNIIRALRTLERNGVWNTTLVFLPGKGEISSVHREVEDAFGYGKLELLDLFGGQTKENEARIFRETETPRIIFTTNVAETSLTIPNVSGVIDSGLERTTEFNPIQKKSFLKLSRISLQNAVQRTGRAGRTRKGASIRLWSEREEASFPKGIIPEILRSDLRPVLLEHAALAKLAGILPSELKLPTEPEAKAKESAFKELLQSRFINSDGTITEYGKKALEVPISDLALAKAILDAQKLSELSLATFAVLDSNEETTGKDRVPKNAIEIAQDLVRRGNRTAKETRFTYQRLEDYLQHKVPEKKAASSESETARLFFDAFPAALAIQNGNAYKSQTATFPFSPSLVGDAKALLVFNLLCTTSSQKSEMHAGLCIKIPEEFLRCKNETKRYELLWRSGQERYIGLEICESGDREISRKEIQPQEAAPTVLEKLKALTGKAWMEKHKREDLSHLWLDDPNKVLLCKMKLAKENFPDFGLPAWDASDLDLVTEDFMDSVFLMRDLSPERFQKKMKEYFGESMIPWLLKTFPDYLPLPNGKRAKYLYFEGSPVELSARIEDFLPFRGEHFIADGKIKVRYDILAPNYRSAQKTWDLTGFWHNTYPDIRK